MESAARFAELVNRPAAASHLDLMAALIGTAFEPDHDPMEVVLGLDRLAEECAADFGSIMSTVFGSGRLVGNRSDYGDPRNSYLHRVLERGLGIPITLSVCAMEIGRRKGVEVRGVGLPGHFVVACGDRFADPFDGGRIVAADELEDLWRRATGLRDPFDERLLQPAHPRMVLLRMLNNLKQTLVALDDPAQLAILARLRSAFPELEAERAEYARWLRHWN